MGERTPLSHDTFRPHYCWLHPAHGCGLADVAVGERVYCSAHAPIYQYSMSARTILERIENRLIEGAALIEIEQFRRLSADEVDVLLRLEREAA